MYKFGKIVYYFPVSNLNTTMSKSPTLQYYTPPKGFMITRMATLAERKEIGHENLVKALAPEIWSMLRNLQGKSVRTNYHGTRFNWCLGRLNGEIRARSQSKYNYNTESFYTYAEFENLLIGFDPTYTQRLWKLCAKALRDEKSLLGNKRKEAAMEAMREYDQKRRDVAAQLLADELAMSASEYGFPSNKNKGDSVKIHIDIEIEAWL